MKQIVSPTLLERMKDDPFFDPNVFDTRGLSAGFGPTAQEDDGFKVPLISDAPSKLETLKHAVRDAEVLTELAANQNRTSDEDAVLKHFTQNPSFTFHCGDWKVQTNYERGSWHCLAVDEEDGERKKFILGGHDKYDKDGVMTHCGRYLTPKLPWRQLTPGELDVISRMASAGVLSELIKAAEQYCFWALDRYADDDDFDPLNPRFQPLYSDAAWYVFIQSHVDVDDEAVEWMRNKLGNRAPTVNALFAVYELWQQERKRANRSMLFNPPEPEPETPESVQESLDNLSDEALADLRTRTIQLANRR